MGMKDLVTLPMFFGLVATLAAIVLYLGLLAAQFGSTPPPHTCNPGGPYTVAECP